MSSKNMIKTDLGDVKPVVEAGGKNSVYFLPNLNMSFFDDEFFININRKEKKITKDCAVTSHKTKLVYGGDTDLFYVDEEGNFKWDIEFTEKPETNIFTWELKCSNDIDFIYQGALTEEEINDGCTREEKIIGSYAVYCNKKNGKYKTGKICHIHKPICIDAEGNTVYAELYIDNKELTITIPITFLDNAIYPMTLDPTFGYTTVGSSYGTVYPGFNRGSIYNPHTAVSGDTLTQLHLYAKHLGTSGTVDLATYTISSGHLDSRLSTAVSVNVSTGDIELRSSSLISYAMTAGSVYGLAFGNGTETIQAAYDDGTGYGDLPDAEGALPATWSHSSFIDRIWSVYATYTEGSGAVANNYYYLQNQ